MNHTWQLKVTVHTVHIAHHGACWVFHQLQVSWQGGKKVLLDMGSLFLLLKSLVKRRSGLSTKESNTIQLHKLMAAQWNMTTVVIGQCSSDLVWYAKHHEQNRLVYSVRVAAPWFIAQKLHCTHGQFIVSMSNLPKVNSLRGKYAWLVWCCQYSQHWARGLTVSSQRTVQNSFENICFPAWFDKHTYCRPGHTS